MSPAPRVIELVEYATCVLPAEGLTLDEARAIAADQRAHVDVESPFKNGCWRLTAQGVVGYVPITRDLHLALQPKVPLGNLFRMLELAYDVGEFLQDHAAHVESLRELYERLAMVLAQRVDDRARRGLYRAYLGRDETTPYLRGRIDLRHACRAPWDPRLPCHYQDHTADLEENHILAWTLYCVARGGFLGPCAAPTVRRAYRQLAHTVSLVPKEAACCVDRVYDRLNADYAPLHALCRFFLDHAGPRHTRGERDMVPFSIPMASLFETYVGKWLEARVGRRWRVLRSHHIPWTSDGGRESIADMVLCDAQGRPRLVLDAKYKDPAKVQVADVYEVAFFAHALGVGEAALVYPAEPHRREVTQIGGVRVRALGFDLSGDLERAGEGFWAALWSGEGAP